MYSSGMYYTFRLLQCNYTAMKSRHHNCVVLTVVYHPFNTVLYHQVRLSAAFSFSVLMREEIICCQIVCVNVYI